MGARVSGYTIDVRLDTFLDNIELLKSERMFRVVDHANEMCDWLRK